MSVCFVLGIVLVLGIIKKKKTDLAYSIFNSFFKLQYTYTRFTHLMYTIQWFLVYAQASQYSVYFKSHNMFY